MSVDVSKNGKELMDAFNEIRSNAEGSIDWALFSYEGKSDALRVESTGKDGLSELQEEFNDGRIQYAFARVIDENTQLPKFVLISWCGEGVPEIRKGLLNSHLIGVTKFFKGFHVQVNARSEKDVEPEAIMKKVRDSSGAKFSYQQRQGEAPPPPVKSAAALKASSTPPPASKPAPAPAPAPTRAPAPAPAPARASAPAPAPATIGTKPTFGAPAAAPATIGTKPKFGAPAPAPTTIGTKPKFGAPAAVAPPPAAAKPSFPKPAATSSIANRFQQEAEQRQREQEEERKRQEEEERRHREQQLQQQQQEEEERRRQQEQEEEQRRRQQEQEEEQRRRQQEQEERRRQQEEEDRHRREEEERQRREMEEEERRRQAEAEAEAAAAAAAEAEASAAPATNITATVMYDYSAQESNELNLFAGGVISYIEKIDEGWWQGYDEQGNYGMFPATYVQENVDGTAAAPEPVQESYEQPAAYEEQPEQQAYGLTAITLYDYQATDEGEISFDVGEYITEIDQIDEGWWRGKNARGDYGLFPANYVAPQ